MDLLFLIIKTIIMGIVEGITEFLPVSSTGHLIVTAHFINFNDVLYSKAYVDMFEIVIQLGAILSVVVLFWEKIINSIKTLFNNKVSFILAVVFIPLGLLILILYKKHQILWAVVLILIASLILFMLWKAIKQLYFENWGMKLWTNILIAFIPSALIGVVFHDKIEEKLFNTFGVSLAFIVGGILLVSMELLLKKGNKTKSIDNVIIFQSIIIGLFQCLSLWPGMSRSASTIMGAWIGGLSTPAAAEFSFFLAIPTMIAASLFSLVKAGITGMNSAQIIGLGVGFLTSFLVALLVIEKFIAFLKRKPLRIFGFYRILAGIVILVLGLSKIITF